MRICGPKQGHVRGFHFPQLPFPRGWDEGTLYFDGSASGDHREVRIVWNGVIHDDLEIFQTRAIVDLEK